MNKSTLTVALLVLLGAAGGCSDDESSPANVGGMGASGGSGGTAPGGGGGTGGGGDQSVCGDGNPQAPEECDDGNLRSHDGCSSGCTDETPTWTKLDPLNPPPRRFNFAMAYDMAAQVTVLFGGVLPAGGTLTNETWEYERGANAWFPSVQANPPTARQLHAMVYRHADSGDRIVMEGGSEQTGFILLGVNTWDRYDSNANAWDGTATLTNGERFDHAMVWDSTSERVLLFGGTHNGTLLGDTRQLTNASWSTVTPSGYVPGPRRGHRMAFDSDRDRVVLFGGWDGANDLDETLEYNVITDTWTLMTPTDSPPGRMPAGLVYDPIRRVVVLFGGYSQAASSMADTWEYDGSTWTEITTAERPPYAAEMVYDARYRRIILVADPESGTPNETWEYRTTSAWPDEVCDVAGDEDDDGLENCDDPDCEGIAGC